MYLRSLSDLVVATSTIINIEITASVQFLVTLILELNILIITLF
jgi:hypothetical protein